jgi:molybdenum cofactor biosynthesis enzyme MoaA
VPLPMPSRSGSTRNLSVNDFKLDSIDLYITSACNRRCSYCFLTDSYFASGHDMSVRSARSIVNWASKGSVEEVTLLGGEPAQHRDFASIVRIIHDVGMRVRTVTNGSERFRAAFLDPGVASALDRIAVSLDAPSQPSFDALRGRNAFRDAMVTVQQLRDSGTAFEVNCTVVKSTLEDVPAMLSFAESLGARRLNIHWFSAVGRASQHAANEIVSAIQWRAVLDEVSAYRPGRSDYVIDCQMGFAFGMPGEDPGMCAVRNRANLQFMPDGNVFSCGMLVDGAIQAGYFWRDGHLSVRENETEISATASQCQGCPLPQRRSPAIDDDGYLPLCIYNRLAKL